ncbi:MAG: DUF1538 domain-containing protein [Treponema sp.]|nr:DUF1538 domain-containing protein [Treponema sp.]
MIGKKKIKKGKYVKRQKQEKMPLKESFRLLGNYAVAKIRPQFAAILLISLFMAAVRYFIFREPLENALTIAVCTCAAILGLSFFLEGLFLGIMPLGEQCGTILPAKIGITGITIFSIIIGITATLAEPAIEVLQNQGSVIPAWDAPLLYLLLNRGTGWLVAAIAAGVGISVALGVYRFMYGWPFKPPIFIIIPVLLAASFFFEENPVLRPAVNLAWDAGGAATGAVTVPIILALGLGVARAGGKRPDSSGFGIVTLASALPVATVLLLAILVFPKVPSPSTAAEFFSGQDEQRAKAIYVAGSGEELAIIAQAAVLSGDLSEEDFANSFPGYQTGEYQADEIKPVLSSQSFLGFLKSSLSAVLPLSLALLLAITLAAREKIMNADTVILGLIFCTAGMFLLNLGMTGGITEIGTQTGNSLRDAYTERLQFDKSLTVNGVNSGSMITVPGEEGPQTYIWIPTDKGPVAEKFIPEQLFGDQYIYVPVKKPIFMNFGTGGAYILILAIVFFIGFLAIFAEPSLAVTASAVEDITTGTLRRSKLIALTAAGVGLGIAAGFARILFSNLLPEGGIHLTWILAPCYAVALLLTVFAPEEFSAIAWDVAGMAVGPVSVPIIITMGLGLGNDSLRADGAFGIVSTAGAFPVIVILVSGIIDRAKSVRALRNS